MEEQKVRNFSIDIENIFSQKKKNLPEEIKRIVADNSTPRI